MEACDFIARYADIYEHSPWVAERVAPLATEADDTEQLAMLMADCVDNASTEQQLELIRAHPDLAGRAQVAGELTADSTVEQASAGLDRCSPEEFERFQRLNEAYRDKFDIPFVMAVRGSNRSQILDAFAARLENAEIHKIARLRLDAMGAKE